MTLLRIFALLFLMLSVSCRADGQAARSVVVYTSVDQVYAEEIFKNFTRATGIRVMPVFDTESGKTTGLYQRLLAERGRPRADVFWNGEICRTIQLAQAGAADELGGCVPADLPARWVDSKARWAAFGLRARIIVYNTEKVTKDEAPKTLEDLTQEKWRGKVAMANPLFGTTATHAAALWEALGPEKAEAYFKALKANDVRLFEGNSVVRDVVGKGELPVGITDTDDFFAGVEAGMPLAAVLPDQEGMGAFAIPNTVMIVKGGPHPKEGRAFASFLLDRDVERQLAFGRGQLVPVRSDIETPPALEGFVGLRTMEADYGKVAQKMPEVARILESIFLK